MLYTVAATRLTHDNGWHGARSVPTFYVDASAPHEAAAKAAEILTGGNTDTANCAAMETERLSADVFEFVAVGGMAMPLAVIG